jgi:hypothetical protein
LKVTTALVLVTFLILPVAAWSQDTPIKIDLAPLLSTLSHGNWYDLHDDKNLVDAVRAALLQAPFQSAPSPGADVLTLAAPGGVKTEKQEYLFTVVFFREDIRLGEALESCPIKKLTECTDQLVLDTKTAANN